MSFKLDPFPLRGRCIGISVSAASEGIPYGEDPEAFVNQLTFQLCSRYLFLGASVALGHMWRPGGVMQHVVRRAAEYRHSFLPPGSKGRPAPVINRIAWPDEPPTFDEDDAEAVVLKDFIDIRQVQPTGIPLDGLTESVELGQFARIRALTAMRRELVALSDFRVCLGGAPGKNLRRLPGVIEEAILTVEAGKPLYLAGVFGGVSKALCDVILQRRPEANIEELFYSPPDTLSLFQEFAGKYSYPAEEGPSQPSAPFDALACVQEWDIATLAARANLSQDDYLMLMTTPDIARATQIFSLGISNTDN